MNVKTTSTKNNYKPPNYPRPKMNRRVADIKINKNPPNSPRRVAVILIIKNAPNYPNPKSE